MTEDFHSFEDYSNNLKPISSEVIKGKLFVFEGCSNNNLISEGSFTRMLNVLKTKSFAIYILDNRHRFFHIEDNLSIGKTAQAYSQHVKKINVPFVFECLEIPGSNSGRLLFKKFNLKYNY